MLIIVHFYPWRTNNPKKDMFSDEVNFEHMIIIVQRSKILMIMIKFPSDFKTIKYDNQYQDLIIFRWTLIIWIALILKF